MRSVAPESAGSAASQKSWFGVKRKPSIGRFTATTLHTIHTAKARKSAGHRDPQVDAGDRLAFLLPEVAVLRRPDLQDAAAASVFERYGVPMAVSFASP